MNKRFSFDKKMSGNGLLLIGTDEAGRGSGAGDVVAAAVYFPSLDRALKKQLEKLDDSKKLSEKVREELFGVILQNSINDIVFGSVEEIEKTNILQTSLNCMKKACSNVIEKIGGGEVLVLVDGNKTVPDFSYSQKAIVGGDGKSASVAAASILAKVARDRYMTDLDRLHPEYCWAKNKGYLTDDHLEAVDKYGLTELHRKKYFDKHFAKQLSLF